MERQDKIGASVVLIFLALLVAVDSGAVSALWRHFHPPVLNSPADDLRVKQQRGWPEHRQYLADWEKEPTIEEQIRGR